MIEHKLPSKLLENTVNEFSKLPGIGYRTALRLVLYLLEQKKTDAIKLGESVVDLISNIKFCNICHNVTETDICSICADTSRQSATICVVEDIRDMMAIENTLRYKGLYHILGGIISPINGVGPNNLTVDLLKKRVETYNTEEIILALPSTMEGDTTSYYLYKTLNSHVKKISTLARGIAFGDQLQYIDEITLGNSITDRIPYKN